MSKPKTARCQRCPRMAHSAKRTWVTTDALWEFAGMAGSDVLCERCFQDAVLARCGRERKLPDEKMWDTILDLAELKLIPLGGPLWIMGSAELVSPELDVVVGVDLRKDQAFVFGIKDGKGSVLRTAPIKWNDRLSGTLPARSASSEKG